MPNYTDPSRLAIGSAGGLSLDWHQIGSSEKTRKRCAYFLCQYKCGSKKEVVEASLRNGRSVSCGCFAYEMSKERHSTHGACRDRKTTPEYAAWKNLISRCVNPRNARFSDYGGRGISVCDRWLHGENGKPGFECFLDDMGPRPDGMTIDRSDNDGNYEPGNCRWATPVMQMANRRNTRMVKTPSGIRPLADLAKECGIPANTLRARLEMGWSLGAATLTPVRSKAPNGSARYQRGR